MCKLKHQFNILILLLALLLPWQKVSAANSACLSATVLVDNSGSMKGNDPLNLRFSGLKLFVSLLDVGDQINIIAYSTESISLTGGMSRIQTTADKEKILDDLEIIAPDGYTDLKSALILAAQSQNAAGSNACQPVLVILTDGKPEIAAPYPRYEEEIISLAAELNIPVVAIALTASAQTPFLESLVNETGGFIKTAKSAPDLLSAYLAVFSQLKDRTIQHTHLTNSEMMLDIDIPADLAPYIEKVSFVLSSLQRSQFFLQSPDGSVPISAFTESDANYAVFTVQKPAAGKWTLVFPQAKDVNIYTILHARLRLKVVSPQEFHPLGEPIKIVLQLFEEDADGNFRKIVGQGNFSALITLPDGGQESLDSFYDDGTHGDEIVGDGDFTRLYLGANETGAYQISALGYKGSVQVSGAAYTTVEKFPTILHEASEDFYEIVDQPIPLKITFDENLSLLRVSDVLAQIEAPSGEESLLILHADEEGFSGEFSPQESGLYRIQFLANDAVYRGISYEPVLSVELSVRLIRELNHFSEDVMLSQGCFSSEIQIPLKFDLASSSSEQIKLSLDGVPLTITSPIVLSLPPGENIVIVELDNSHVPWAANTFSGSLTIQPLAGLNLASRASLPVILEVPPIFQRCRREINQGLLWSVVVLSATITFARKVHKQTQAPLVTGTLRYGKKDVAGQLQKQEWDMTDLYKEEVCIGSQKGVDLYLHEAELEAKHAVIKVQRDQKDRTIMLVPVGKVRRGYRIQTAPFLLQHGESFEMGTYLFQYLSDSGE